MFTEALSILTNIQKGSILEDSIHQAFSLIGANVDPHYVNREGLDLQGKLRGFSFIGEAINWYGGYIHPYRFKSIVEKLSTKADFKFFFTCGVKPTRSQILVLKQKGINLIHLPKQLLKYTPQTVLKLQNKILGVIYNLLSISIRDLVKEVDKEEKKIQDQKSGNLVLKTSIFRSIPETKRFLFMKNLVKRIRNRLNDSLISSQAVNT